MKKILAAFATAAFAMFGTAATHVVNPPAQAATLVLISKPLPLNQEDIWMRRTGSLTYLGGLHIQSPNKDFGGISAMQMLPHGVILAVSDTGNWVSFRVVEKRQRLASVRGIALVPMRDMDAEVGTKKDRDAEAVMLQKNADGSTSALVAFEGRHRIWQYDGIDPEQPATLAANAAREILNPKLLLWPDNGGAEASCITAQGLVQFSEDAALESDVYEAVRGDMSFAYKTPPGFKPTECQSPSSGNDIFMLHRRFSPMTGVAASIGIINADAITAGAKVEAREIARLEPPLTVDNMEAMAVLRDHGRTYIYIMSDDNFNGLQRTILLKFEYIAPKAS